MEALKVVVQERRTTIVFVYVVLEEMRDRVIVERERMRKRDAAKDEKRQKELILSDVESVVVR